MTGQLKVLSGRANLPLARKIAAHLDTALGETELRNFADGEIRVNIKESVRGADVFVDGAKVLGTTPATVEVRRDHRPHTIEVRKEGFLPATQTLRYDREVHMQLSFQLQRQARSPAP